MHIFSFSFNVSSSTVHSYVDQKDHRTYDNNPQFTDGQVWAKSVDPDQTAPKQSHPWSVSTLFASLSASETRHDKTNKMSMRPAKTQISLGIRPVRSVFACTQWVAKHPRFIHADSEDSDQTERIWVFAERTLTLLVLSCRSSSFGCITLVALHF